MLKGYIEDARPRGVVKSADLWKRPRPPGSQKGPSARVRRGVGFFRFSTLALVQQVEHLQICLDFFLCYFTAVPRMDDCKRLAILVRSMRFVVHVWSVPNLPRMQKSVLPAWLRSRAFRRRTTGTSPQGLVWSRCSVF